MKDLPQKALEDEYGYLHLASGEVTEMVDYRWCGRFSEVIEDNRTTKVGLLKAWRDV